MSTISTTAQSNSLSRKISDWAKANSLFLLVVAAFLTFRLLLVLGFGSIGPDIYDYMRWGSLADSHFYPFVNYWSEYPPLFSWSAILLYRISTLVPALPEDARFWFAIVLRTTMTLFDLGSLILMYGMSLQIGTRSRAVRAAGLFAAGFVIAYAASGWYDSMPLFFLLLALYLGLRDRWALSAIAGTVGFLIKIVPLVVLPIVLRRIVRFREQAKFAIAAVVTTAVLTFPFLMTGSQYVMAFLHGTFNRPSWGSIWAILEGGYTFGAVIPVQERFSAENVSAAPVVSPLPWPMIHLAFLGLFLFIYTRRINWRAPLNTIAFAGLTVNLFLLWSKGFSGQFAVYAFPFILLLMPNFRGMAYAAMLSLMWIGETPLSLLTFSGSVTQPNWFTTWVILTRTAVLVALCFEYAALMFPRPRRYFTRFAAGVLAISWISVAPASVALINSYTQVRLAADPAKPAIDFIASSSSASKTIVLPSDRVYRRLLPAAQAIGETLLLPLVKHVPDEARSAWLDDLAARGPFWFVEDEGDPESIDENRAADAWTSDHACKVDMQWAGSAKVSRFVGLGTTPIVINSSATFANGIDLTSARLSGQSLQSGGTLCVELDWKAIKVPANDYTVFVHLVNSQGQLVAQTDLPPRGGYAPTSQWKAGSTLADKHGLIVPTNLPGEEYNLQIGMYRSDNQAPVKVTQGNQLMPDAIDMILTKVSVIP